MAAATLLFSKKYLLPALAVAAAVPQAQGTETYGWAGTLNDLDCTGKEISDGSPLQFTTEAEAKAACEQRGISACWGIFDTGCDGTGFVLCDKEQINDNFDLGGSSPNCITRMMVITTQPTTSASAAVAAGTTSATTAAASSSAVSASPAATTSGAPGSAATTSACGKPCMDSTCREQIVGFVLPPDSSGSTGSMPSAGADLTCENKRAMVSAQDGCSDCSGCDVCEATATATAQRLWRVVSDGDEKQAGSLSHSSLGASAAVTAACALGAAALLGAVAAAAAVLRRRTRWEHLGGEQQDEA